MILFPLFLLHLEADSERQHVLGRHRHVFHDDRSRHRRSQGELALDFDRGQARHALRCNRRTYSSVRVWQSWGCYFLSGIGVQ